MLTGRAPTRSAAAPHAVVWCNGQCGGKMNTPLCTLMCVEQWQRGVRSSRAAAAAAVVTGQRQRRGGARGGTGAPRPHRLETRSQWSRRTTEPAARSPPPLPQDVAQLDEQRAAARKSLAAVFLRRRLRHQLRLRAAGAIARLVLRRRVRRAARGRVRVARPLQAAWRARKRRHAAARAVQRRWRTWKKGGKAASAALAFVAAGNGAAARKEPQEGAAAAAAAAPAAPKGASPDGTAALEAGVAVTKFSRSGAASARVLKLDVATGVLTWPAAGEKKAKRRGSMIWGKKDGEKSLQLERGMAVAEDSDVLRKVQGKGKGGGERWFLSVRGRERDLDVEFRDEVGQAAARKVLEWWVGG